ncbi:MAG: protein kinase, partial [Oscillospiraceae bacterium]|nr:protein kinase [Oscillospiraceae bacterium]
YIAGITVAERLAQHGRISKDEAIDIAVQLCGTLAALHGRTPAIIHRDIKPANVMLTENGAVLLDFDAAKLHSGEAADTVLLGTAGFAAPEQYGFTASTAQTDLYAVGVLLNTMLLGVLPTQHIPDGPVGRVIRRCLKMEPRSRWRDADELKAALLRAKQTAADWLPPGFRTLKWYKMLPAAAVYAFFSLITAVVARGGDLRNSVMIAAFVLAWLSTILFLANYMGLQRLFPLMRAKRLWLRAAGALLSLLMIYVAVFALVVLAFILLGLP